MYPPATSGPTPPRNVYAHGPVQESPPVPMSHHEKSRLRAAAFHAKKVYPGPVGELISGELLSWEDFGYVLSGPGMIRRLVDHVLAQKAPEVPASV